MPKHLFFAAQLAVAVVATAAFPSNAEPPTWDVNVANPDPVRVRVDQAAPVPVVVEGDVAGTVEVSGEVNVRPPPVEYVTFELVGDVVCDVLDSPDDDTPRCPLGALTQDSIVVPPDKTFLVDYVSVVDLGPLAQSVNGDVVAELLISSGTGRIVVGFVGRCAVLRRCLGANTAIYVSSDKAVRGAITWGNPPRVPATGSFQVLWRISGRLVENP